MIKKTLSNTCLICEEEIHTQMCQNCLSESMAMWADIKRQALKQKEFRELYNYIKLLIEKNPQNKGKIKCLSCNQRNLEVCPACFAGIIQGKMESLNINRDLIKEFRKIFWFNGKDNIFLSNSETQKT